MRKMHKHLLMQIVIAFMAAGTIAPVKAADDPVFVIELKDGAISPQRIEVPAGMRIVLEVHNAGRSSAEFESKSLKKEVVVTSGTTSIIAVRNLDPGEYPFIDDFHHGANGLVVAK